MTVRDLSARLEPLGFRLSPSGVSEIENATRKVSVDELLILAIALNASVIDLLTPADGVTMAVAKDLWIDAVEMEAWLQGAEPWPPPVMGDPSSSEYVEAFLDAASEQRKALRRLDSRPEIAAIDRLRYYVAEALRSLEGAPGVGYSATEWLERVVKAIPPALEEVNTYITLLLAQLERKVTDGG